MRDGGNLVVVQICDAVLFSSIASRITKIKIAAANYITAFNSSI